MQYRRQLKVLVWGTYDTSKPRVRIVIDGLAKAGVSVEQCHVPIWEKFRDKSQITGHWSKILILLRFVYAYPVLLIRLLFRKKPDVLLLGYPALTDIIIVTIFAKIIGITVIWDVFISLHNTIVEDRQLIDSEGFAAKYLLKVEGWAFKLADLLVLDTDAHAQYISEKYNIHPQKMASVFVGAEDKLFAPVERLSIHDPVRILFYGQFIPLHGIVTIVEAARKSQSRNYEWVVIGQGQESEKIRLNIEASPIANLTWIPWVGYEQLRVYINDADICLGIFGDTKKASMVIPNKVFQIVSAGKPIITRNSPAIRELFQDETQGVKLIPPADPDSLLQAISELNNEYHGFVDPLYDKQQQLVTSTAIGSTYKRLLRGIVDGT